MGFLFGFGFLCLFFKFFGLSFTWRPVDQKLSRNNHAKNPGSGVEDTWARRGKGLLGNTRQHLLLSTAWRHWVPSCSALFSSSFHQQCLSNNIQSPADQVFPVSSMETVPSFRLPHDHPQWAALEKCAHFVKCCYLFQCIYCNKTSMSL